MGNKYKIVIGVCFLLMAVIGIAYYYVSSSKVPWQNIASTPVITKYNVVHIHTDTLIKVLNKCYPNLVSYTTTAQQCSIMLKANAAVVKQFYNANVLLQQAELAQHGFTLSVNKPATECTLVAQLQNGFATVPSDIALVITEKYLSIP
jgi:hypothetical protein